MSSPLPDYPLKKSATNLFTVNGATYPSVVDYFFMHVEVMKLRSTTSLIDINAQKAVFAHPCIPERLISDYGPHCSSFEFTEFVAAYDFKYFTSSPHYLHGNGQAWRMVKTVKKILKIC